MDLPFVNSIDAHATVAHAQGASSFSTCTDPSSLTPGRYPGEGLCKAGGHVAQHQTSSQSTAAIVESALCAASVPSSVSEPTIQGGQDQGAHAASHAHLPARPSPLTNRREHAMPATSETGVDLDAGKVDGSNGSPKSARRSAVASRGSSKSASPKSSSQRGSPKSISPVSLSPSSSPSLSPRALRAGLRAATQVHKSVSPLLHRRGSSRPVVQDSVCRAMPVWRDIA